MFQPDMESVCNLLYQTDNSVRVDRGGYPAVVPMLLRGNTSLVDIPGSLPPVMLLRYHSHTFL